VFNGNHMIDDPLSLLSPAVWLLAAGMWPVAFLFGACSPCCQEDEELVCSLTDGKDRSDPKDEGTWVPSGAWRTGVTWSFTANPGDESGETWFFYGSAASSKLGGGATTAEQRDYGNLCNWYSNKTTAPSDLPAGDALDTLNRRATRLPPSNAVIHVYTELNTTSTGPVTVKEAYFWSGTTSATSGNTAALVDASTLTATGAAHDSPGGVVFSNRVGGNFSGNREDCTINSGAAFNYGAVNSPSGTVNGDAVFNNLTGSPTFAATNDGIINGDAVFNDDSQNRTIPLLPPAPSLISGSATFNNTAVNFGAISNGAVFNDSSENGNSTNAVVNGGAIFNDSAVNRANATVNGGATFNDAACSTREIGSFFLSPCTRRFVAHPTDLPICNGTAPNACVGLAITCGCG
jgi:hypothetical protein